MKSAVTTFSLLAGLCLGFVLQDGISALAQEKSGIKGIVARGKMLVTVGGCNDCHSPKVFTAMGPVPDTTRLLSGHPANDKIPEIPPDVLGPAKWGALTTNDLTAWAGPWGVSYTANLTPDQNSGLGKWTATMFIKALRTGKHMGEGRQILPPMPWEGLGQMSDADLIAVFAYLRTLRPVQNTVPDPVPPPGSQQPGGH